MTGAESNPDVMPPDGTPKCSPPKDNRVGGVAFVGGSSLSSGTTGVRVDTSVDEENEFLANKRWGPWDPVDEIAPPNGRNLLPVKKTFPLWIPPPILPPNGPVLTKLGVPKLDSSSKE